jgi:diguanylate cyclase (GGDEF)-like protein
LIKVARRALTARVARRVFFLFVVSAFVPLALMAVLSITQVRQALLEQAEHRLAAMSKAYATTTFEHLLLASETASTIAALKDRTDLTQSGVGRYFVSLGKIEANGKTTMFLGKPILPSLPAGSRQRLASGKQLLVIEPQKPVARVYLLIPGADRGAATIIFGEILPEFLWGHPDMLPAATEFCVIDDGTRTVLFCTVPMPDKALTGFETPSSQSTLRSFSWTQDHEIYRAVAWSQFLQAEFGTGDWVVVASQLESHQLAPIREFRQLFIPVVLLAVLLVTWLSVRQIRSTLVPVGELAAGARRIEHNDFSTPVDVNRNDEFGELATAFNHMSARLARQFETLTALAEIDRLILSGLDTEQIIRTVLERIDALLPADFFLITLLEHDNPNLARTYGRESHELDNMSAARQGVSESDRNALGVSPRGFWISLRDSASEYLSPLRGRGMDTAYVQPIIWRETVCGALTLGFRLKPAMDDESQKQIRDFADRVAVAISSAWRDEQLYQQAHFDSLTGLPNRLLLRDRLTQEIARCQREVIAFALLFIDLDNFKAVNDGLGHTFGDMVLKEAARRISICLRESDTVSRLGGDEFNVILTQVQHPQDAGRMGEKIIESLSESFSIDGQTTFLSASIGIALYPDDGKSAEDLIKNADTAMYRAKANGRAQAVYFEENMNAIAVARVRLDRELRQAIDRGQFKLVYQPLVDLRTERICGAEALLRWDHPELGSVSPVQFIPIAEESAYIEQIGRWVMHEACRQMKQWQTEGVAPDHLAVNVSARQFRKAGLVDLVKECTQSAGIPTSSIEIEITETVLIGHGLDVERILQELVALGVTIALDDFGTGFSSMSYLKRFPVHTVKIDRVFVKDLPADTDSEAIVTAIIAMAHALGKSVTAEGVETDEQWSLLRKLNCDRLQGYRFSRPLPSRQFAEFVTARNAFAIDR